MLNNRSAPAHPAYADLHLLTVLAQTRSFTLAARRLALSKASVSVRIADLERAAGVALVRRTTRSVSLTQAGQMLVEETQEAFDRIAASFAGVRDLAGHPRGLVRLTAPVALGRQYIAPTLPGFLARHPEVRLDLDLNDRLVKLSQEGFDLAIRHVEAPPETHVAWPLCDTRSLLVASPDYLARAGTPQRPEELARLACLPYLRDGGGQAWTFESTARRPERVTVQVHGPLRANNSEVLRQAAQGGLGIGLLPDFSAAGHLRDGHLVQVLPGWRPLGFFGQKIYAIRPGGTGVPRAVQCLVDYLKESLGGGFAA